MSLRLGGWLVAAFAVAWAGSACTLASPTHISMEPTDKKGDDDDDSAPAASTGQPQTTSPPASSCGGSFTRVSPSGLTACGNGMGHCYDKAKVPQPTFFAACPDPSQVCVEDSILQAGGGKLRSCTSIIGAGACINLQILDVPASQKQQATALKQDVCDSGDICVPCTDPTNNNAPTPFCQPMGVYDAPCSSGGSSATTTPSPAATGQACCATNGKSNGICIASSAIPASQRESTIKDTCTGDNQCVPASLAGGNPVTCDSGFLGKGVCIDKCFSSIMGMVSSFGFLSGDGCGSTEVCVPCLATSFGAGGAAVPGCN